MNSSKPIDSRTIYFYVASFVGLMLIVVASARLIELGLQVFFFEDVLRRYTYPPFETIPKEAMSAERVQTLVSSLAMLFVGLPLFLFHWSTLSKTK